MSASPAETPAPLAVSVRLFAELEARGVRYCHWKSTPGLPIAMAGKTDLDLLVEREDAGAFADVVRELGFKPFISHPSRRFPAVDDLLGYDPETGRLVHLHVYYQLILGEHFVKNHRLPFERALIAASRPKEGVRIPPPELEVAILAYRTLLKYRDADATKDLLRAGHRGGIPRDALAELRTLVAATSPDAVAAAMREHMPGLSPEPVMGLMKIVTVRPRDARALVRVRRQARRALRPFERSPARSAWGRYMRARLGAQWPLRLLTRSAGRRAVKRKSPQAGGLMVAIVGSDGAGKSTAVSHIVDWLAWRLNVSVAYLGSSQPSRGTAATKRAAKLARAAMRRLHGAQPDGATGGVAGVLMALRHHGDARDRARRARAAHGLASRGVLVLLDRYPLPNVTVRGRALDGPRIRDTLDATHGLIAGLAAREERLYRELPRPDHLIVLRVSAAVAKARRPEHAADDLAARAEAMSVLDAGDLPMTVIDADRPLDEVLAAVRATIWRLL